MSKEIIPVGGYARPNGLALHSERVSVSVSCRKSAFLAGNWQVKVTERPLLPEKQNQILKKIPVLRAIYRLLKNKLLLVAILFSLVLDLSDLWLFSAEEHSAAADSLLLSLLSALTFLLSCGILLFVFSSFRWHGAEHKVINTYTAGKALSLENVKGTSRVANRCGTNLMFYVIPISLLLFEAIKATGIPPFSSIIVLLSLALSVEIMDAKRLTKTFLYRKLEYLQNQIQRWITTREPADWQLECAMAAMKELLAGEERIAAKELAAKEAGNQSQNGASQNDQ